MNETPIPETSLELIILANHNRSSINTILVLINWPNKAVWRIDALILGHFSNSSFKLSCWWYVVWFNCLVRLYLYLVILMSLLRLLSAINFNQENDVDTSPSDYSGHPYLLTLLSNGHFGPYFLVQDYMNRWCLFDEFAHIRRHVPIQSSLHS